MPAARYQNGERAAGGTADQATRKAEFLKALSDGHTVNVAAKRAGVARRTPYGWREADAKFAARWQALLEPVDDPLEAEAQRRAVEGIEKPIYRGGTLVGHGRDYSDSMLMFLLKAKYPEKYDRRADGTKGGDPAFDIEGARDALLGKFAQETECE